MGVALVSKYGTVMLQIAVVVFLAIFAVTKLVIGVVLLRYKPSPCNRKLVFTLEIVGTLAVLFMWGFLQGFQMIPFYASFLLSLTVPIPVTVVVLPLLLSSKHHTLLYRKTFYLWTDEAREKSVSPDGTETKPYVSKEAEEAEESELTAVSPTNGELSVSAQGGKRSDEDNKSSSSLSPTNANAKCPSLRFYMEALVSEKLSAIITLVTCVGVSIILILTLYGGCLCVQPIEITTMVGRVSQKRYCYDDEVCHVYTIVGPNETSLVGVAHFVSSTKGAPAAVSFEYCPITSSDPNGPCAAQSQRTFGQIRSNDQIQEDLRYIGVGPLSNLIPDTHYKITAKFHLSSSATAQKSVAVKSLPSATKNITFIGGGDFHTSSLGSRLLKHASFRAGGEFDFIYIGGDLAYANNMRYCYRRWDDFFERSMEKRKDGYFVPYLTTVGNHEGGGYQKVSGHEDRAEFYYFYSQYFPVVAPEAFHPWTQRAPSSAEIYHNGDETVTFHSHLIGITAWIVLDSGIMFPIEDQYGFIDHELLRFSAMIDDVSNGNVKKIVAMYHNAGYPSVRKFNDPYAKDVREKIVPRLDKYAAKLPWVLENHDHAYKRTKRLLSNSVVNDATHPGITFSGDGCLGVYDFTRSTNWAWYHEKLATGNYFLTARISSRSHFEQNGGKIVTVEVGDEENLTIDEFQV